MSIKLSGFSSFEKWDYITKIKSHNPEMFPDKDVHAVLATWSKEYINYYERGGDPAVSKMVTALTRDKIIVNNTTSMSQTSTPLVNSTGEHTGKSVSYYKVDITNPTTPDNPPYMAECNDIIEALGMNYAEANCFKSVWRICAARNLGKLKAGNSLLYDAEKNVFFAERMLSQLQATKPKEQV